MKRAKVIIFLVAIFFIMYFLQVNFFNWFNIKGVQPNLFVVLALFVGIFSNAKVGQIFGFATGLYIDFLFSNSIGISAVLYSLIGYSGELLQKRFPKDSKITIIIMSSITTAVYEIIRVVYRYIFFSSKVGLVAFIYTLAIELIFNALLIIILYPLIHKLGSLISEAFNSNEMVTKYF